MTYETIEQSDMPVSGPAVLDVVPPARIARLVEDVGIKKAGLPFVQTLTLGVLAGAFIGLGAMFYTVVVTGSELGFGPTRLLGGLAFSLGLLLVVIGGAELFTGNNLIVMAWADGRVGTRALLRNWGIVYLGNLIGRSEWSVWWRCRERLGSATVRLVLRRQASRRPKSHSIP